MYSVVSVRKRLLECLDHRTLAKLANFEGAPQRSRTTLIKCIISSNVWTKDHDIAIQVIVDQAKSK